MKFTLVVVVYIIKGNIWKSHEITTTLVLLSTPPPPPSWGTQIEPLKIQSISNNFNLNFEQTQPWELTIKLITFFCSFVAITFSLERFDVLLWAKNDYI